MANLSLDFTGEPYQEAEVNCFAIPGPGGVLQFRDVLTNGYWHARGPEFLIFDILGLVR
jgi:hypothetical protein